MTEPRGLFALTPQDAEVILYWHQMLSIVYVETSDMDLLTRIRVWRDRQEESTLQ